MQCIDNQGNAINRDDADSVLEAWHRELALNLLGGPAWRASGEKPRDHLFLPHHLRP